MIPMSEFSLLCADATLWNPTSSATWGSLNFCLLIQWFKVHTIKQTQLTVLSQAEAWENMENPKNDMAFLLIALSLAIGCERIFGLIAMWAHPHQICLVSLVEVTWCLVLLDDEGPDWPYTFVWMNNTVLHMPLSSEGHLGVLTEGKPQRNLCGLLHQLQAWRLLQCRKWVVWPGGLNAGLKVLVFDFEELPLWNVATTGEAAWDPSMIEVDLCSTKPKAISTTLVPPVFSAIESQPNIAKTLNLHIQGVLEWLQQTSPTTSMPVSQHSTPGKKLPSVALGAPPSTRVEDPLSLEGADSAMPKLMATSSQVFQHVALPDNILTTIPISHSPSPPPRLKTLIVTSVPFTPWLETCPRVDPGTLSEEALQLQREMNVAMGQLLTTRTSMDSCQRRLVSNTKTTLHLNEAKTAVAIKEAKAHCNCNKGGRGH